MITQEILKQYLSYDSETGIFTWIKKPNSRTNRIKIGSSAGWLENGYIRISIFNQTFQAHRLAWFYIYGCFPKEIDHINIDRLDNRLCNLRKVTHQQNCFNFPLNKKNTSGYTGVSFVKKLNKFRATIVINYKQKHLGVFKTAEDANLAYQNAKKLYHTI
jgi:hypothetical protein